MGNDERGVVVWREKNTWPTARDVTSDRTARYLNILNNEWTCCGRKESGEGGVGRNEVFVVMQITTNIDITSACDRRRSAHDRRSSRPPFC